MQEKFDAWFDDLENNIDTVWRNDFASPCLYNNQYCAFVRGANGKQIWDIPRACNEKGGGPGGAYGRCISNSAQKNDAITRMKNALPSYKPLIEGQSFPPKVRAFYEGDMIKGSKDLELSCTIDGEVHKIVR